WRSWGRRKRSKKGTKSATACNEPKGHRPRPKARGQRSREGHSGTHSGDCEVQTTQETGAFLMPVYSSTSRKVTDLRAHRLTLIKAAIVQYLRECSASQWYW